jgi:23S rRNA (adenine2503-C2)-methyltransferase
VTTDLRTVADLRDALRKRGARPVHVRRLVADWLTGGDSWCAPRQRNRIPRRSAALEASLPEVLSELDGLVREIDSSEGADGSRRRLLRLRSGRSVESVDLPREGLCVSTQVGCAVGCRFCRTGQEGLLQQLTPLEILAQVVHARRLGEVRRIVFMGMGEPAHNLEAVLETIDTLADEGGLAHRVMVFSTVGDPDVFARLAAQSVRPALALSLHSLDSELRRELLPRAPWIDPRTLLEGALDYAEGMGTPLLLQWTLLEGINDSPEEARELGRALRGRRVIVNYIPFNEVEGSGYRRPPLDHCRLLTRTVRAHGALATLRLSAGQEIEGGCGQLRARGSAIPTGRARSPRLPG